MNKPIETLIINLSMIDFNTPNTKHKKLNSPTSIKALNMLGLEYDDLYYLSFKEYKNKNYSLKELPSDVQQRRYNYHETKRLQNIEQVVKVTFY